MRELTPWQQRSVGRSQHRSFYAAYMRSAAWYDRRTRWATEASARLAPGSFIECLGCGGQWLAARDDLHHLSYDRLGDEAHEDLWPMCRTCHTWIHELMVSTSTWRKLPRPIANTLALTALQDAFRAA